MADLEAIRARAAAALPGPWAWFGNTETDTVHLATDHSGRCYVLAPATRDVEYVYHHWHAETYPLAEYRADCEQRWIDEDRQLDELVEADLGYLRGADAIEWREDEASTRARAVLDYLIEAEDALDGWDDEVRREKGWDHPADRAELRLFLLGERRGEDGAAHLEIDGHQWLSRSVQTTVELRFPVDGRMRSYRDLARYEVLDGRTRAEAGLAPDANRTNSPLYREDIVGIASPEAEFLAHARQDVDELLAEVDRLRTALVVAALHARIELPDDVYSNNAVAAGLCAMARDIPDEYDTWATASGQALVVEVLADQPESWKAATASDERVGTAAS